MSFLNAYVGILGLQSYCLTYDATYVTNPIGRFRWLRCRG